MIGKIVMWNKERNGLEYDGDLEIKMLSEEVGEFYHSIGNLTFMTDAIADFLFVYYGTLAKLNAKPVDTVYELLDCNEDYEQFKSYTDRAMGDMLEIYKEALKENGINPKYMKKIIHQALYAVIEANKTKGKEKDGNGKIKKGDNYVAPEYYITEMLAYYYEQSAKDAIQDVEGVK